MRKILFLSDKIAVIEKFASLFCIAFLSILMLLNVVTRSLNNALFWTDELAIYMMVWAMFFSTSILIKRRTLVAVTILPDLLDANFKFVISAIVDWVVLLFAVFMLVFSWQWFEPLDLILAGFDFNKFSMQTGNFIYQNNTNTLPLAKFWFWLIVPVFSVCVFIHSLCNAIYIKPKEQFAVQDK